MEFSHIMRGKIASPQKSYASVDEEMKCNAY